MDIVEYIAGSIITILGVLQAYILSTDYRLSSILIPLTIFYTMIGVTLVRIGCYEE